MKIEDLKKLIKKTTEELRELNDSQEESSDKPNKTEWISAEGCLPRPDMIVLGYGHYRADEDLNSESDTVYIVSFNPVSGWYTDDEESSMIITDWSPIFDLDGNLLKG